MDPGAALETPAHRARESPTLRHDEIATNYVIAENRPEELAALVHALV